MNKYSDIKKVLFVENEITIMIKKINNGFIVDIENELTYYPDIKTINDVISKELKTLGY